MRLPYPSFGLLLVLACGGGAAGTKAAAGPSSSTSAAVPVTPLDVKIRAALDGTQRPEKERARDAYRHPRETLELFGLEDHDTVVEISPGEGWYTAILAPVLHDRGKLIVVGADPNGDPDSEGTKHALALEARFRRSPHIYDKVERVVFTRDGSTPWGPPESADMVVTFRNLHNWLEEGIAGTVLGQAFKVLKHGGVLGLTDHRAAPGAPTDAQAIGDTGYVPEDYAIKVVEGAGFKLADKSEINANPKDTKDYPKGVWTLPPVYAMGELDRDKYQTIGESDRMTLKFVKP